MSDYALFDAWNKSLRWGQGCGTTASDTVYCGLQIYDEPFPCPNGLPIRNTLPRDVPFMVARVERARIDAERWARDVRVYEASEAITMTELLNDIEEIRSWAQLQKRA